MTYNIDRRRFVGMALGTAVLSGAGFGSARAFAADPIEVAGLFSGNVTQGNWDPPGYAAFMAMANKYNFKPSYVDNATYEAAPSLLRQMAGRGVKMIICHSSGFSAAIEEVAKEYPNTQFVLYSYASDTAGLKNYSAWSVDWDQYGFVTGAAAAASSKAKHIAIVAGEEIPSAKRAVEFTIKGAKSIAPDIKVDTVYVGSFTDIAKAKEIATGVIARGVDVLIPSADLADVGTQQAAEDNQAYTIGSYMDQSKDYPDAVVTSTVLNFNKAFDQMGQYFTEGKLNGSIYTMDLSNDGWTMATPFRHVDASVQAKVFDLMSKIEKKQISVE